MSKDLLHQGNERHHEVHCVARVHIEATTDSRHTSGPTGGLSAVGSHKSLSVVMHRQGKVVLESHLAHTPPPTALGAHLANLPRSDDMILDAALPRAQTSQAGGGEGSGSRCVAVV